MANVALTIGMDGEGDACVYFAIHDNDGNHIRYASEDEIQLYLDKLAEACAEPTLEDLGLTDEDIYQRYECQNCGTKWTAKELEPVEDVLERVAPGEKMPAGQCPECGAVCHQVEEDEVGDDMCDACGESNRVVDHIDEDGNTVCTKCVREDETNAAS